MIGKIQQSLTKNQAVKAWIIRHEKVSESQQYALKTGTESVRVVNSELYSVDLLCDSQDGDGKLTSGLGTVSLLPGDEIDSALEKAVVTARLVNNEPYDFLDPAPIPELDLVDNAYLKDPVGTLSGVLSTLRESTDAFPHVRIASAEVFGQEKDLHLVSSKGIDAQQKATEFYLQWVYLGGAGDSEVETFAEIYRRKVADLHVNEQAALRAGYTSDLLNAGKPRSYDGPVFIQDATLAAMVAGAIRDPAGVSLIQTLSSGSLKYTGETPWEIGKSIFRGKVKGDSFQAWANRTLPYGMDSDAFDKEGIPAQRVALVDDNKLAVYIADQRFADYLKIPATGAFGNLEIPAGKISQAELQSSSGVEIAEFSWFYPDRRTGDFACEIRLGYVLEDGQKKPFKGGLLIGNLLDALADVNWSAETGFYGNYLGPRAARFNNLKLAG